MKVVTVDVKSQIFQSPYEKYLQGLSVYGIPWIPLFGKSSFRTCPHEKQTCLHKHRGCVEIIYCCTGACEYETTDGPFVLNSGEVFVSRSHEPHRQVSMPKGYVAVHFLFRPTKDADTRWLAKAIAGVPRHFNGGPRLRSRFGRIFTILNAPGIMKSRGIRLRLRTEVTAMMLDILDAAAVATRKGVTQGVLDVAEEMKAHPERRYPLSDLAARFGTSLTSVVNDFKAAVGFTPHAYLLHCRIDLAKRSLKAGYSMRAVADMTGFPSAQHLATTFRNITGQTPSGWLACT